MGLELNGTVRATDKNLDVIFILMGFRAKRLVKINKGKPIDGKQKRIQK